MSDASVSPSAAGAVFLSYAREDSAVVQRLAEALRGCGVEVWFDQNELVGGDTWDAKIRGQIASCALFVPMISTNTQGRREGYFRLEWRLAAQRSHMMSERAAFLLPVVIDGTREAEADVPAEFKAVQWTRLVGGELPLASIERIKRLLAPATEDVGQGRRTPPIGAATADAAGFGDPALQRKKRPRWIGAVAAAAAAAIAVGAFFFTRKPAVAEKSIAVLPFANLGADKNDEYLGNGMTEELLNVFAKVPKLKVAARTSSFFFKGKNLPIAEVAKQLGVAFVLEGSVRKTGNKLRITTQLINATDGYHLWSETYDRDMTDLLAIQSEVSQQVVKALLGRLGVEESRALTKRATVNPEAHRLYLLGRYHFAKANWAGYQNAERYFSEAIRIDPNHALAYCGLADNLGFSGGNTILGREAWGRQKELAEKALAIDPDLAEAHFALGLALADMFDWQGGERAMRRALDLNPAFALGHDQLAWLLICRGRFDEGIAHSKKAVALDPLSPLMNSNLAAWLYYARRYDEAINQARKALELEPNFAYAHGPLGWCLYWKGDVAGALTMFQKQKSLDPGPWWDGQIGYAYAASGERGKAMQLLQELDELAKQRYVPPGPRVLIYLSLGEIEKAMDWLDKCYADQDGSCWMLKVDPIYDPVREHPRFKALLKKVGLDQ